MSQNAVSIIKEIMNLTESEKHRGREIVSLGVGVPFYGMPDLMLEHVISLSRSDPQIHAYTSFPGIPVLRVALAEYASEQLRLDVQDTQIIVTPGSMAALLYAVYATCSEGDEIIVPSPYFVSYADQAQIFGAKIVEVPLIMNDGTGKGSELDISAIESAITARTKAIIVNSPHNPTGAIFSKESLLQLAEMLKGKNIFVITDEAYDFLTYDSEYFNISAVKELWPHVIRCCSFSKKYGVTGWRIGYVHASEEIILKMQKLHENSIVCAPRVAQEALLFGLRNEILQIEENKRVLESNKQLVCQRLNVLSDLFAYPQPQGAFYVMPKFSIDMSSAEFAKQLLLEAGVVVLPGVLFGATGEGRIRISFGGRPEEITKAFDLIEKWWKERSV